MECEKLTWDRFAIDSFEKKLSLIGYKRLDRREMASYKQENIHLSVEKGNYDHELG
jgi:hypothetical protein